MKKRSQKLHDRRNKWLACGGAPDTTPRTCGLVPAARVSFKKNEEWNRILKNEKIAQSSVRLEG